MKMDWRGRVGFALGGSGQVVQLEVPADGRGDLGSIVLGMKMETHMEARTERICVESD
jgi:hypothetical protein